VKGQPFPGAQYSATAGWMHLCYDDAGVTAVYEKPLSCSGVTWGGVLHVRMYLALMLQEFVALQLRAIRRGVAGGKTAGGGGDDKSSATKCLESIGVDQGIHNMLLHNGTFDRYVRMARVLLLRGFHVLHFHVLHFHVLHFHVLYFLLGSLPASLMLGSCFLAVESAFASEFLWARSHCWWLRGDVAFHLQHALLMPSLSPFV
jgi:hypothetical protein